MSFFVQTYLPRGVRTFRHKPSARTEPTVALLKSTTSTKATKNKGIPAEAGLPASSQQRPTQTKSKVSAPASGPVDLDEDVENYSIMLVEIEQVLRDNQLRQKNLKSRSCSSVSSCSFASSTASFSDSSSMKETRRVVFSDKVTYVEAVKLDKAYDRRQLWWNRKDQQEALKAMRHEARLLASSSRYRAACTTVLLHCKALAMANEQECLAADNTVAEGGSIRCRVLLTHATPPDVVDAVRYLVDPQVRGLERACLTRLRLRLPGRPCYYWRCSPVRATASVLQLQDRLSHVGGDLSDGEKSCLLSVQYQPYGFYASTWAQLLAEGDALLETMQREAFRRVSL